MSLSFQPNSIFLSSVSPSNAPVPYASGLFSSLSISILGNWLTPRSPFLGSTLRYTKLSPYLQVFLTHIGRLVSTSITLLNKSANILFILFDSEYIFNINPCSDIVVASSDIISKAAEISGVNSIDS